MQQKCTKFIGIYNHPVMCWFLSLGIVLVTNSHSNVLYLGYVTYSKKRKKRIHIIRCFKSLIFNTFDLCLRAIFTLFSLMPCSFTMYVNMVLYRFLFIICELRNWQWLFLYLWFQWNIFNFTTLSRVQVCWQLMFLYWFIVFLMPVKGKQTKDLNFLLNNFKTKKKKK